MPCHHIDKTWEDQDQSVRAACARSGTWLFYSACYVTLWRLWSAANICYKIHAAMLSEKWDQPYSTTLAWMICKLSFALLRSAVQCIQGVRSSVSRAFKFVTPPIDLVVAESSISVRTDMLLPLQQCLYTLHHLTLHAFLLCFPHTLRLDSIMESWWTKSTWVFPCGPLGTLYLCTE